MCFIAHYEGDRDMKMNGNTRRWVGGVTSVFARAHVCHKNMCAGAQCEMGSVKGAGHFNPK